MSKAKNPRKIHLGCGRIYIPGFFHVDIQPAPHVDAVSSGEDLSFIDNDTVELIYASHVLEHFDRWHYHDALVEWHRVLKPGGVLRLSVPDFEACVRAYQKFGLSNPFSGIIGLVCGGQRDLNDFHRMIFNRDLLTTELKTAGFNEVRDWNWRTTEHSHIDDYSQAYLPHMDKTDGMLMSLNLEAVK